MSHVIRRFMFVLLIVLFSAGAGAYTVIRWPTLSGFTVGELRKVQEINTEIVKQTGRNAALLYDNSDIVMRYSHHVVGHPNPVNFCPECFGAPIADTSAEMISEIDQSPSGVTSEDIVRDAEEIHRAVTATGNTIAGQRRALLFSLLRLRSGSTQSSPICSPSGHVAKKF